MRRHPRPLASFPCQVQLAHMEYSPCYHILPTYRLLGMVSVLKSITPLCMWCKALYTLNRNYGNMNLSIGQSNNVVDLETCRGFGPSRAAVWNTEGAFIHIHLPLEGVPTNMYKWVNCVFFYRLWLVLIWTDTHLFGFMFEIWNPVNAPWNIYQAIDRIQCRHHSAWWAWGCSTHPGTSHGGFMGTSWENIGKSWKIRCKWRFKWENMI